VEDELGRRLIGNVGAERNTARKKGQHVLFAAGSRANCFAFCPCDKTIVFTFKRSPPRSCREAGPIPPDHIATPVNRSATRRNKQAIPCDARNYGHDY
jgi:hypothetical protein